MKVLALGSSEFGGDWHPLAAVLGALEKRGHEVMVAGDGGLKGWVQKSDLTLQVRALSPGFHAFMDMDHADLQLQSEIELFEAWNQAQLESTRELIVEAAPDLLLSSLLKLPMAVKLRAIVELPLCFVNPSLYFNANDPARLRQDYPKPGFRDVIRFWSALQTEADLVLHASSRHLEPDLEALPPDHYFLGPTFWELPGDLPDYMATPGPPWVLVGMSTAATHREIPFIQSSLDAMREMSVRVLVTVGDPSLLSDFDMPANGWVERYVPHLLALMKSSLFISHGGHGGVMKALFQGVPMVLLPRSADQFAVSTRANRLGVAEIVARDDLTVDLLEKSIERVLKNPVYSQNVERMSLRLSEDLHIDEGCDLLEGLAA